ncbi:MAG: hypothetical protein LUI60_00640, partial [Clostridia bacterium]|nr:hypothetical protein [Clostridia bacterium]
YIDVYIAGAIMGILNNRKADVDNSPNGDTANLLASQVIGEQSRLKFLYRLIILLHDSDMTNDEKVDFAFRNDTNQDVLKKGMDIFNSYARGGIELLYEKFTEGATTKDDYIERISEIVAEFADLYDIK